jgi:hypothetical protein
MPLESTLESSALQQVQYLIRGLHVDHKICTFSIKVHYKLLHSLSVFKETFYLYAKGSERYEKLIS